MHKVSIHDRFFLKKYTVKVMILSASQFYVTANQVGNCVAITANQISA